MSVGSNSGGRTLSGQNEIEDVIKALLEKRVETSPRQTKDVFEEPGLRLDASTYSNIVAKAKKVLIECGFKLVPLESCCETIFNKPRFKRIRVESEDYGYPYMSPTDLFYFKPLRSRFVSKKKHANMAEEFFAQEGWILLTCSGTIGRPILVTKSLTPYFYTHDLIRIVPKQDVLVGYIYAYLCSWIGQALMKKDEYGLTVDHIEPHHIKPLPVPLLPNDVQERIHQKVMKAYEYREQFLSMESSAISEIESLSTQ